ncbi:hypothetical protein F4810DRAFT_645897 [Camillea tinctor]|nr:hypothetical protein F4810DRAFT_645897 [Camillea tinctor]
MLLINRRYVYTYIVTFSAPTNQCIQIHTCTFTTWIVPVYFGSLKLLEVHRYICSSSVRLSLTHPSPTITHSLSYCFPTLSLPPSIIIFFNTTPPYPFSSLSFYFYFSVCLSTFHHPHSVNFNVFHVTHTFFHLFFLSILFSSFLFLADALSTSYLIYHTYLTLLEQIQKAQSIVPCGTILFCPSLCIIVNHIAREKMSDQESPGCTSPCPTSPSSAAPRSTSTYVPFPRPVRLPFLPPHPSDLFITRRLSTARCNRYEGIEADDADQDRDLLLPHAGESTTGRKVLFRHQQVLKSPESGTDSKDTQPPIELQTLSPIAALPPVALPPVDGPAAIADAEQDAGQESIVDPGHRGVAASTNLGITSLRMQRWRDRWVDFKRRMSPAGHRFAGIGLAIVVLVAIGGVIYSWYALVTATMEHQSGGVLPDQSWSSSSEVTNGTQTETPFETYTILGGNMWVFEDAHRTLAPRTNVPAGAATTDTLLVTTTVQVSPSCTACSDDDGSYQVSPITSTPTASSPDTAHTTAITTVVTTATMCSTQPMMTSTGLLGTELPPPAPSVSFAMMTGLMYCPCPTRHNVWTLCLETHTQMPNMLDPTDMPAVASSAAASLRVPWPIASVLSYLRGGTTTAWRCLAYPVSLFSFNRDSGWSQEEAVRETLRRQLQILREQQVLLWDTQWALEEVKGLLGKLTKRAGG